MSTNQRRRHTGFIPELRWRHTAPGRRGRLKATTIARRVAHVVPRHDNLDAHASHPYDYEQFLPDHGTDTSPSNSRPWRILGLQHRYTAEDDDFRVHVAFQYEKAVTTEAITLG